MIEKGTEVLVLITNKFKQVGKFTNTELYITLFKPYSDLAK